MKRRKFIKTTGALAAGAAFFPTILPSGIINARTGSAYADHVVFIFFAGGVRQQESVLQRYLTDSQGLTASGYEGNIMYNMLNGGAPTRKIVYGTNPVSGPRGSVPIPPILSSTLQSQGLLFPEVRAAGVGHYTGLCTLTTGSAVTYQGLRQRPTSPTIFEYARKYLDLKATDVWFLGNTIGNSIPLLNYSSHADFGVKYGANFFAPLVTFGAQGESFIKNAKVYHPDEQLTPMYEMQAFLDQSFGVDQGDFSFGGIQNTPDEKLNIKNFIREMFRKKAAGTIATPPVADDSDMQTLGYACEVMKWFKPKITVVNMSNVDGCHTDFTGYLRALHRADHGVGHVWNYIQTQIPEMAGNTMIIAMPEHGRNLDPNSVLDENDWKAFDHSDINSTRIFSLMAGPHVPTNLTRGSESSPIGDISNGILTVAEALGIKEQIMSEGIVGGGMRSFFDLI